MIIAVDPGKTCGLIVIKQDGKVERRLEADGFRTLEAIEPILTQVRPLSVVVERYTITRQIMTQQTDALEVIGALRWLCFRQHIELRLQSRADRTRVTNEMLREVELWSPRTLSPGGHINEAARHAVVFLATWYPRHPIARYLLGKMKETNGVKDGAR